MGITELMKRHAPATSRNREAIATVLQSVMPASGSVLEVASGSGEHLVFFASQFPQLSFQPSDIDPLALASIDAWVRDSGLTNVRSAIPLDATEPRWPIEEHSFDGLLNINMIHIASWASCLGVVEHGRTAVVRDGFLFFYGPFFQADVRTAESNLRFDAWLKQRNPEWGIRDLERLTTVAAAAGFSERQVIPMPANNLSVVFRRRGSIAPG